MVALAKTVRPKLSPEGRKAILAMRQGIALTAEAHERAGVPMAIWKDGRIVLVSGKSVIKANTQRTRRPTR